MKILIVHEVDYLEKVIYEIQEFPELLAQNGHDVVFFQFQEGARRAKKNHFKSRRIRGRTIPEVEISLKGPHQFGIAGLDRLWATISCIPAFIKLFRENNFDVVLNYAVPTFGLQLLVISRFHNVPFVHRALDSSHEIRQSIFKWPILWAEKLVYRFTPLLSANNEAMKGYCSSLSGRTRNSVVNYPPLDIDHFAGQTKDASLQLNLGIDPSDNIITYMGSFFYFSGLPDVIKRFSESPAVGPSDKLLLIGGGEQDSELRKLVSDLDLKNRVLFTGFVSYDQLPRYLALSKVAINPLEMSRVASIAFPNKVLQYLASGLPVVSTRLQGLASALVGIKSLVWAESPSEVFDEALRIAHAKGFEKRSMDASAALKNLFSPSKALKAMEQTLYQAIDLNRKS